MGKKEQKTKEAKIAAALAGSKKGKKKKWSKQKLVAKKENLPIFIKNSRSGKEEVYEEIKKSVQKMKLITICSISEKFQINGSLARKVIQDMEQRQEIKKISSGRCFKLFTNIKNYS